MPTPGPSGPNPPPGPPAFLASPGPTSAASAEQPTEPIWPRPQPFTANLLKRLSRGLGSWFGLLNEWDFRIGIGSTRCFGLELVLVNRPALVRQVLVDEPEAFPKHPYTQWILEPLIGQGIFAVNGAEWQRQRRLVDQALQTAQLRRVFPLMEGAVQAMLDRFEAQEASANQGKAQNPGLGPIKPVLGPTKPGLGRTKPGQGDPSEFCFDAQEAMTLVTADVIVRTILSKPLDPEEAQKIFAAFARYQRRASLVMVLRFLRLPKTWLQRLLHADAGLIRNWIGAAIAERSRSRASDADGSGSGSAQGYQDLLDALERAEGGRPEPLASSPQKQTAAGRTKVLAEPTAGPDKGGHRFSQEELIDQVCVLFLAGHETSASALALACYLLARYGSAVLQETLRLYPPLSFFIRESQAPSQLGESRCPMGALLAISPWVIQRHEQHWSEPNSFRPERFLGDQASEAEKQWAKDAYLPFGLGPRKCPGAAFALQEALLVLAELVSRYELLPEAGQEPQLVGNLTLRSRNGVRLRLRRRHGPGLEA